MSHFKESMKNLQDLPAGSDLAPLYQEFLGILATFVPGTVPAAREELAVMVSAALNGIVSRIDAADKQDKKLYLS